MGPWFAGDQNDFCNRCCGVHSSGVPEGFNHVVGPTRFVGYFLQGPDVCRVTVFKAAADDEQLLTPAERVQIDIAAADLSELAAGDGSALAIACTVDADAIKIAPQRRDWSASR